MKRFLFAIEFALVLVLFALPPVFAKPYEGLNLIQLRFTFMNAFWLCVCGGILFIHRDIYKSKYDCSKVSVFQKHALALTGFGLLLLISALFEFFTYLTFKFGINPVQTETALPASFAEGLSLALCIVCGAVTEEILYRFYIPDCGFEYSEKRYKKAWEIFAVLIFAAGHLYLGWMGFFNALCCGVVLRILFLKSQSLWLCTGVHCVYNLLTFIFSAVL